jgi:tetratricopeptide (TPR) repeat protein
VIWIWRLAFSTRPWIARKIQDNGLQSNSRLGLGGTHFHAGRFRQASAQYRKALRLAKASGSKRKQTCALIGLGNVSTYPSRALQFYKKALLLTRKTGDLHALSTVHVNLGYALAGTHPGRALRHCRRSVELVEKIGYHVPDDPLKIAFYGERSAVYPFVVPLCLRLHLPDEAFAFVERSKSKAFLESLSGKLPHVAQSLLERESSHALSVGGVIHVMLSA